RLPQERELRRLPIAAQQLGFPGSRSAPCARSHPETKADRSPSNGAEGAVRRYRKGCFPLSRFVRARLRRIPKKGTYQETNVEFSSLRRTDFVNGWAAGLSCAEKSAVGQGSAKSVSGSV